MLERGYVQKTKHPKHELYILNYTASTQYDKVWNEVTLQCRGLVINENDEIIARPFPKFFNLSEHDPLEIPNEPFEVFEKLDGSLGILYFINEKPQIATRGSFTSPQALKANQLLSEKYTASLPHLDYNITYLFEIIYPENRIVVDYGDEEKLVLIEMIETKTGKTIPLKDIGFPIVQSYSNFKKITDFEGLKMDNREGFVLKFKNGFRVKIKFEEYVRLHRIITQCSSLDIWEALSNGSSLSHLLEKVPDEFYHWVKKVESELKDKFLAIEKVCSSNYKTLTTRKETAIYFQTQPHPDILFKMLDGKEYNSLIWKKIRPIYQRPFSLTPDNDET